VTPAAAAATPVGNLIGVETVAIRAVVKVRRTVAAIAAVPVAAAVVVAIIAETVFFPSSLAAITVAGACRLERAIAASINRVQTDMRTPKAHTFGSCTTTETKMQQLTCTSLQTGNRSC